MDYLTKQSGNFIILVKNENIFYFYLNSNYFKTII